MSNNKLNKLDQLLELWHKKNINLKDALFVEVNPIEEKKGTGVFILDKLMLDDDMTWNNLSDILSAYSVKESSRDFGSRLSKTGYERTLQMIMNYSDYYNISFFTWNHKYLSDINNVSDRMFLIFASITAYSFYAHNKVRFGDPYWLTTEQKEKIDAFREILEQCSDILYFSGSQKYFLPSDKHDKYYDLNTLNVNEYFDLVISVIDEFISKYRIIVYLKEEEILVG